VGGKGEGQGKGLYHEGGAHQTHTGIPIRVRVRELRELRVRGLRHTDIPISLIN